MVSRVARDAGVRALAIKGPALELQGLRGGHVSSDVDIWVDPATCEDFRRRMASLGWIVRIPPTSAQILPLHSVAVAHERWPCEVDIHDRYPGFFADPQAVFEVLWQRRHSVHLAGASLWVPDRLAHALVAALHSLRDSRSADLEMLIRVLQDLSDAEKRELQELSERTGSSAVLAEVLTDLGIESTHLGDRTLPLEWDLLTHSSGVKSVPALFELSRAPLRRWPRLILRSLVLTEAEIREKQPTARPGSWGLTVARLRRVGWGMKDLPLAIRLVLRHRRRPPIDGRGERHA
ncbi:nucleotidyltransferase family protein [Nocardioides sp. LS1]|uniref:nucleotidyltransferase family protein n=1 Tax=Nocardioides sp. LS1 TaxID=1027620 RepID=UPI000F61623D